MIADCQHEAAIDAYYSLTKRQKDIYHRVLDGFGYKPGLAVPAAVCLLTAFGIMALSPEERQKPMYGLDNG